MAINHFIPELTMDRFERNEGKRCIIFVSIARDGSSDLFFIFAVFVYTDHRYGLLGEFCSKEALHYGPNR